jgi:hypothetical protein
MRLFIDILKGRERSYLFKIHRKKEMKNPYF